MAYKVFISHSHHDARLARDLARRIQTAGAKPYIAEAEIKPRANWIDQIRSVMRSSDEVVVLLTSKSVSSEWLSLEMGVAFGLHKLITPITFNLSARELPIVVESLLTVSYANVNSYVAQLKERVSTKKTHSSRK